MEGSVKLGEWVEQLPSSPHLCLLGDKTYLPPGVTKVQFGLLVTEFITAARVVLKNWENTKIPEITMINHG